MAGEAETQPARGAITDQSILYFRSALNKIGAGFRAAWESVAAGCFSVKPRDGPLIASLLILLQSAALPGQAPGPPGGPPPSCQASEIPAADRDDGPVTGAILYVGCGQSAVRIGRVDSYRSSYNPGLGTLAVAVRRSERTRVLVVRRAGDGTVEMQDVSGDLAKLAGQPFNVGLRALEVDLGRFGADGTIAASIPGQSASGARLTPDHYIPPAAERRHDSPGAPSERPSQ